MNQKMSLNRNSKINLVSYKLIAMLKLINLAKLQSTFSSQLDKLNKDIEDLENQKKKIHFDHQKFTQAVTDEIENLKKTKQSG